MAGSRDDQIERLQRRNRKNLDDHAKTVNAKNEEIRALRDAWELFDTYPALQAFLVWLHKIRDAAGPLRSPTYQPGRSAEVTSPAERGAFPDRDRSRLEYVNRKIEGWTQTLEDEISPKGPLVDDEIPEVSKPVCHNPACPARFLSQAFDQEICYDCKTPFTEHRPPQRRCWTRDCPFYGKSNACLHVWQKNL
jgi:hypothetical protein